MVRRALAMLAAVVTTGCFEEPVEERLHLAFEPDGTYEVRVVTAIAVKGNDEGNRALARRLAQVRYELENGLDPWAARFPLLEPAWERIALEREEGVLVTVERRARGSAHEALRRFLDDAGLYARVTVLEREMALEIVPGAGGRATRAQRELVEELMAGWSGAVTRTLEATARLYAHAARFPDDARPCLSGLFREALTDEERAVGDRVGEDAGLLVEAVRDARDEVLAVFELPEDQAYTFNELSHLVYDPFPARLSVAVPGEPSEVEGFRVGPDGSLEVAGLGLYEALRSLAGRWARPDPIVAFVEAMRSRGERLSLDELSGEALLAVAPAEGEVRQALEDALRPAPFYRVVWPLTGTEDDPAER